MSGKIIGGAIVLIAFIAGVALYYLQVYHFYDDVTLAAEDITLTSPDGAEVQISAENIMAIDAGSSPIRFRACFTTKLPQAMLSETYETYEGAEPLNAPHWFDCFDADEIGAALESGAAVPFLGSKNIAHGVDRVVAIFADGRGFVWHQVNEELKK